MKLTIKKIAQGLLIVPMFALSFGMFTQPVANAACEDPSDMSIECGAASAQGDDTPEQLFGDAGLFTDIVNIMLFLVGAVAVIMLIIGGIRYVVSGGDQNAVTAAKNTILYAIIGIVVAVLAFAIVNFVLTGIMPQ